MNMFEILFTSVNIRRGNKTFTNEVITDDMPLEEVTEVINGSDLAKVWCTTDEIDAAKAELEDLRSKVNANSAFDDWTGRINTFDTSGDGVGVQMSREPSGGITVGHLDALIQSSSQS
tara:strand:+ start:128 stop:481 length:354 start_codon:yes stop_codon:yes gene_type:complete